MTVNSVEPLIEKLSSDFVLADPENSPKSLTSLLPTLKSLHKACKAQSMDNEAEQVLKIKNMIHGMIKESCSEPDSKLETLSDIIAGLRLSISRENQDLPSVDDQIREEPGEDYSLAEPEIKSEVFDILENSLDQFDRLISTFCPGELPDLGTMIMNLQEMAEISRSIEPKTFHQVVLACLNFVETTTLEEIHNTKPMEEGLILLRSILTHLKKNEEFVFDFSDVLVLLKAARPGEIPGSDGDEDYSLAEPEIKSEVFDILENSLDQFDRLISTFCPGELPDLGTMIMNLQEMAETSRSIEPKTFHQVVLACLNFVETTTLEEIHNTKPMEEGLILLRSILTHLKKNEEFVFDFSDVLVLLKAVRVEKNRPPAEESPLTEKKTLPEPEATQEPESGPEAVESQVPRKISDDDMAILIDFVSESEENLDTIEISLIDLEQDPANKDIINDIFRPFHTIKGVSGFLSLTKINILSHTTENLLDSARSGDFIIEQTATDAILESVDTLKKLVGIVRNGTQSGFLEPDDHIDVDNLTNRLKQLQISLTKGEKQPIGEILVNKKLIDQDSLEQALESQKATPEKKLGEILVDQKKVQPQQMASALMDQNISKKRPNTQVKVDTRKLDDLVDYAGELVIAQSMLRQKTSGDPALSQTVSQLGQIVSNMQTISMSMRMIPIKATFMKMIRLVRDLSRKSGKNVTLNMFGEDTEIDRNVVDALYEPMVHMIRNSVDHGIEPKNIRNKAGKPEQGTINLRAYHKGGHIIIEIEDDGKGLDRDAIYEKAKNTELISGNEQMNDGQIYELIMQPGFSTAKEITDVSGRGVGMDVVKDGIEKFRGHLGIESEKGLGTKFTISLPLTMAIIDGMLVRVGSEKYVIPTISIQKAFRPGENEYFTVKGKGEMVKDRGSLIPLIRLNRIYGSSTEEKTSMKDSLVVVVESKDEKRALLIDELLDKDEYVIKSLGSTLKNVEGLAGGAILADGRVGLILDIHGIFSIVSNA